MEAAYKEEAKGLGTKFLWPHPPFPLVDDSMIFHACPFFMGNFQEYLPYDYHTI
jgi:hypothetical protein